MGLTGGEEHEQVFSKLHLYAYITKHMTKISKILNIYVIIGFDIFRFSVLNFR